MSHIRLSIWLAACVLITCYGRQGTHCLAAVLATNSYASSGQPGIVFPSTSNDAAYQQQGAAVADASRDYDNGDLSLFKRLRLDDLDTGSPAYSRLSAKELIRLARINELLDDISNSIPSRPIKYSRPQQSSEPRPRSGLSQAAVGPYGEQQQHQQQHQQRSATPIQRSGRTFPASHEQTRYATQSGSGASLRAANYPGLVWTPDGQVKVRVMPPSGSSWALAGQDREASALRAIKMLGNQEIPIPTPLHALPKGDYETKRVESSRGWNNLRGMWGKRSAAPLSHQQQQQQQQLLLNEAASATSDVNYDDGEGDGDSEPGQRQQPAPPSIRPM